MEQFTVVLDQLIGFAIMLVIGYICVRCKVYGEKALEGICQLILKVGIPLMVFSNATAGATRDDLFESGVILVFQAVMYVLLISSTWLIAKVMRLPVDRGHIFQAAFIFGNVGFIGLPLLIALFPERGALFYSLMALLDQFLMWTYGVWLTRSERTRRERPTASLAQQLRGLLSPGLVSVIVSLLVILIGIPIPEDINTPLHTVGSISTPLSLMYIGGLFALRDWKTTLKQPEVYVGIVVKMLIIPIVLFALLTFVPPMLGLGAMNADMVHAVTVVCAMPTMTALVMFAERERNMPEYAVGLVLVTTVASLLTLTGVSYVVF
ncbi:AEC family transporter [Bifidobacterium pullorum]|uniref:AEC family transporter n=1 Tax=Bifidobacterium pullorum TaxID=78448 RepID=UPI003AF908C4